METKVYDCCIIGCSVAGMTAAISLGKLNKTVAIIDTNIGGNLNKIIKVENVIGVKQVSGGQFATAIYDQMFDYQTVEHIKNKVISVGYKHGIMLVKLDNGGTIACLSMIVATGTTYQPLNLKTNDQYLDTTAKNNFKTKPVIVNGSDDKNVSYALELAKYCKKVYLCDSCPKLKCNEVLRTKIIENSKIEWLPNTSIMSVINDEAGNLVSIQLQDGKVIPVNAIFTTGQQKPNTAIFKQFLKLDTNGYAITDDFCVGDAIPGVFAAGDCRVKPLSQITTAITDGQIAALSATKYLNQLK